MAAILAASLTLMPVTSAFAAEDHVSDQPKSPDENEGADGKAASSAEPIAVEPQAATAEESETDAAAENPVINTSTADDEGDVSAEAPKADIEEGDALSFDVGSWAYDNFTVGVQQRDYIDLSEILFGAAFESGNYTATAEIDADSGIEATVENGQVVISGTPVEAGDYLVNITSTSTTDPADTATGAVPVKVTLGAPGGNVYVAGSNYESTLAKALGYAGDKSTIWVKGSLSEGTEGITVIPATVTTIIGVEGSYDWSTGATTYNPKLQSVGHMSDVQYQFASGSQATVSYLDFNKRRASDAGVTVTVRSGANVTFKNCTFDNTPVVESGGSATFKNCTFETGEINASGTATYTGTTQEPANIASAEDEFVALGIDGTAGGAIGGLFFDAFTVGAEHADELPLALTGTNAETVQVSASIDDADCGLSATVEDGKVKLSGTPTKAGTFTVTVTAEATDPQGNPDKVSASTQVTVMEQLKVQLKGNLQAVVAGGSLDVMAEAGDSKQAMAIATETAQEQPRLRAMATGGGSSGGAIAGSDSAGNTLIVQVAVGDGEFMDLDKFNQAQINAGQPTVDYSNVSISVERQDGQDLDCGMSFDLTPMSGVVTMTGTAQNPGTYNVYAHVSDGYRTAVSDPTELRVYPADLSFKDAYEDQVDPTDPQKFDWDMEPYVLLTTGNAEIGKTAAMSDTQALHINGSHEEGVYGEIGNNQNTGSELITIKSGANVTFHNMKFLSSVRIVVEEGAKLTLDKSCAFGEIDVYGTLSAPNGSTVTDRVFFMDGSVAEDLKLASHTRYLTDGNQEKVEADCSFIVADGATVTVKGDVELEGDSGASDKPGQAGLYVGEGATVNVPEGSSLTVTGGSTDLVYSTNGGDGIVMGEGSTIQGDGNVGAKGGDSYQGEAGSGVSGNGTVSVGNLVARGGNSAPEGAATVTGNLGQAGNGTDEGVDVSGTTNVDAKGGEGANAGVDVAKPAEDPDDPSNPDNPGTTEVVNIGWVKTDGVWRLYDAGGNLKTGWQKDAGSWYLLDKADGAMKTGWQKVNGSWYYLNANGKMKTGWLKDSSTGAWYYLNPNGTMRVGWAKVGDAWYYFAKSGAMKTGWLKEGGAWYFLNKGGAMQTGWLKQDNAYYYFNSNGKMAANTWIGKYHVAANGKWDATR